jgi:hypothetical protein
MKTRFFFIILLSCRMASASASFVHPGMLHTQADLDFVKAAIRSGREPWKAAWWQMQHSRYASPATAPQPFEYVDNGPYNVPDNGGTEFYRDGNFAYTMALLWYMSGDAAYAEKAVEIINAWSYTLKDVINSNRELKVGVAGIKFLNAAEIIRCSYGQWKQEDQAKFESMILDIWYRVIQNFKPATTNGNWHAAIAQTMMCIGIYLDRQDIFDRAYTHLSTSVSNGSICNYFSAATGQCQESGRDQGHTQMGMSYLCNACEIAWNQGYDLYGAFNNRLSLGYEYTSKYMLGEDVPYTRYRRFDGVYVFADTISPGGRGAFNPIYERLYNHYNKRKGMPMPYTRRVIYRIRDERLADGYMPWCTLMSARYEPEVTPAGIANLNMLQWGGADGADASNPLPDGYGARPGHLSYFSRASETFNGQPAIQMTYSATAGTASYFITPCLQLEPGEYEATFYVKGSGFFRTVNLCTPDAPESDRRAHSPQNETGITIPSRPMGSTVKAIVFDEWVKHRTVFAVRQKADYALVFAHNNRAGAPDESVDTPLNPNDPLLVSAITFGKLGANDIDLSEANASALPKKNVSDENPCKISVSGRQILLEQPSAGTCSIYAASGQLLFSRCFAGKAAFSAKAGVYIVKTPGRTKEIIVK